jgi:membrane protein DedA with SNARE-associated domain
VTFLVCGAVRVSFSRFLIADALAALITTPLMLGLGYVCAEHYQHVLQLIREIKLLLVVIGLCIAVYLYFRFVRNVETSAEVEGEDDESSDDDDTPSEQVIVH